MIVGLGVDLVDIRRIERLLARYGERFTQRVFTEHERGRAERQLRPAETYAKRYAAKEACAKALGTGFGQGVGWRDIEVLNLPSGKPTLRLTGGAWRRLQELLPEGMEAVIEVTLADEPPLAQAIVLILTRPLQADSRQMCRALRSPLSFPALGTCGAAPTARAELRANSADCGRDA